ncbi:DUF6787 family protein [Chondrinema litorale]|uniref:DUF6787 family protein n=1 Tax=Chondrinema litorale TaxID=2994555 RepID=UPI0025439A42|nr:DUF6787 family protein [Chondrinema litorale]UZR92722.1 prolipoprotein diacylglyceryl transferase [Chondrinema litorale]
MAKWIEKLKTRWGVKNGWQVLIILIVFAITGSSTAKITALIFDYTGRDISTLQTVGIYFLGFLIYQVLLITVGAIFGQFTFFWNFEKRMWGRMFKVFKR